jgi:hypothetical protein
VRDNIPSRVADSPKKAIMPFINIFLIWHKFFEIELYKTNIYILWKRKHQAHKAIRRETIRTNNNVLKAPKQQTIEKIVQAKMLLLMKKINQVDLLIRTTTILQGNNYPMKNLKSRCKLICNGFLNKGNILKGIKG